MRSFRLMAMGVLALFAVSALAACGDDDSTTNTPTKAATTSSASSPTSAGAKTTTSTSGNPAQDLQQAASNLKDSPFKVVYEMSQTDSSGKTTNGTLTLVQKDKKSYVGGSGDLFGTSGAFALIDDGTNTYLCTASPQKACIKTKSTGGAGGAAAIAAAFAPDKVLEKLNKSGATVKQVTNQTIAGRDAKCYSVTDSSGTGTGCIDSKSNLLLLADGSNLTTDGTKTTMKATEVNTSPADSEFEPPYPVQSLPGQ